MSIKKNNDKYNAKIHLESKNKIRANNIYASLLKKNTLIKGNHFILESENFLTSDTLNSINISDKQIHIANSNKRTYKLLKQRIKHTKRMISTKYFERTHHKFSSLFLDYMCTIHGNTSFQPVNDLKLLLDKNIIKNNAIVGFTFSSRHTKDRRKKYYRSSVIKSHNLSEKHTKKKIQKIIQTRINSNKKKMQKNI